MWIMDIVDYGDYIMATVDYVYSGLQELCGLCVLWIMWIVCVAPQNALAFIPC